MTKILKAALAAALSLGLANGCATVGDADKTLKGTAIGAAAGAVVGAAVAQSQGKDWKQGAAIGAAGGAVVGSAAGFALDAQEEKLRKAGIRAERDAAGNLVVQMSGDTLKFESAKAALKPEGEAVLGKLAGIFAEYPENRIAIEGHTDDVGKDDTNQKLSQERADSVKAFLLAKGLSAKCLISATGYGESKPVADNKTAEGKAMNRRVELKISVDQAEAEANQKEREKYRKK